MKFFNFRKRFYQKVTHSKIIVSKTIIEPLNFKIQYGKVSIFKPTITHKQDNMNSDAPKSKSQTLAKQQNYHTTNPT